MSGRDRLYLVHIAESITRINNYVGSGKEALSGDVMRQDAVVRNLQVLAESTKRLSVEAKSIRPDIDWDAIAAFRNVLVHEYLEVDIDEIWRVVANDLPQLGEAVGEILREKGWT